MVEAAERVSETETERETEGGQVEWPQEKERFKWHREKDGEGRARKGGLGVITRDGEGQEADRERESWRESKK